MIQEARHIAYSSNVISNQKLLDSILELLYLAFQLASLVCCH
uniref:Ribosomal protein L7Ae/L30e/S12e/Gadd45 family protein n=1 Tax=Rhizophora mucronata TaxID=61149 RepID=A0A2P2NUV0_RHIMU